MSRDKQIEEMAKIIGDNTEQDTMWPEIYDCANALYNAGYRKSTEVAEEIFAEIEKITFSFGYGVRNDHTVASTRSIDNDFLAELKKKYTQDKGRDKIAEFGKYSPLSWRNTEEGK